MAQHGKHFYGFSRIVNVGVATVATSSTTEVAIFAAPFNCRVRKCSIIVNTAITGQNTSYQTLGFKNKGSAGAGTDVIASKAFTSGVNATQYDETDIGTPANNRLNEGDTVTFYKAVASSGQTMPALIAQIRYTRI